MELAAPASAAGEGVGSATIADLLPEAVAKYGARRAVMFKDDSGQWVTRSYDEVGDVVRELALGLIALGVEKGDKVSILGNTRVEWTYFDFAALTAGATVVPIYQTNSAEECEYVLENSDAKVVIVEDADQLEKIRQVRDRCPKLEHVIRMTGSGGGAISVDELTSEGRRPRRRRTGPSATSRSRPDDICTFIYTSGTTGPAQGLRDLARQLPRDARHGGRQERHGGRGRADLPVPAARALVRAADPVRHLRAGRDARLLGARPAADHGQPGRGEADLLPVGAADLREDLHGRDGRGREGGRAQEADLRLVDRGRQALPRGRARPAAPGRS